MQSIAVRGLSRRRVESILARVRIVCISNAKVSSNSDSRNTLGNRAREWMLLLR